LTTTVRPAQRRDIPAILAIYNDAVLNTTASYDYEPHTLDQRLAWYDEHLERGWPMFVAEDTSGLTDAPILGWCALGKFRDKIGYRYSTEHSIYIAPGSRQRGIGSLLLPVLIASARSLGYHSMIAGMDASNEPSRRLHARFGFEQVAHFKQVGFKFGRWLDLIFMQRLLTPDA
jgi:phosphinothricin acetyltransferase